jgi:hypothetical protein
VLSVCAVTGRSQDQRVTDAIERASRRGKNLVLALRGPSVLRPFGFLLERGRATMASAAAAEASGECEDEFQH